MTLAVVQILAHDTSTQIPLGVSKVGRVTIGDEVFIGQGAIVFPNIRIGNSVAIGSVAVIFLDILDNSIAVSKPIQITGTYDDFVEKYRGK